MESTLVSQTSLTPRSPSRVTLPASIACSTITLPLQVFVDSGSDDNFIDQDFVAQANLPTEPLDSPKTMNALDGRVICRVTRRTVPLSCVISGNHRQTLQLLIIPCGFGYSLVTAPQPPP